MALNCQLMIQEGEISMREVYKEYAGDSGANWILDLDGPDGNV